ncbi:transcriptional regulator, LysR family [Sphingomonas laterariae]|uniref:Transcriptional regulator, LysR family n=1 Tax=Edaphosphingomonas laterariae TaxID=861865 RepID=A0A239BZ50_9SPHN|nr:LysR family transcriptional regulator [Sphingomonas laterariae]SNS12384.1 transcriptional regulator, LysR family [Sphingomonas laterariae]
MIDWNDLRYFLAVAHSGSTLAAGRTLGVSQTTAARRVAALEAGLGLLLFERRQAGYALTAAGEALLAQAEAVETAAMGFADAAAAYNREVSGTVRLTTQELYAVTVLAPILRDLHAAHPGIRIELDTSDEVRDLGAGGADVALRSADRPTGGGLAGRRVADDMWTVYCSRDYAARHGRPTRRRELAGHPFIGGGGPGVWRVYRAWLERSGLEGQVAMHHDSETGLLSAIRSGIGLAVLPCFMAEGEADLVRCLDPMPGEARGLWLLTHERVRHTPRVRAVMDFLGERLGRLGRERAIPAI